MGAITVSNLGKAYKHYPTRWSRLREWFALGKQIYHQPKWVLRDISFTIRPGEAVGIIGINGAGKSTLLKLLTGTAQPTTGSVHMVGRVAGILELGMGFHPDFTGRQNVFMAGQLLGMSGDEVSKRMPDIEAFAEIGEYIDQPVRVYSSGMQVRLAFSVATAIRPDILIIDEALSVGDAYFQHKSFDRIREFRKQGTTLLIVSHDKQAIQTICDRAILLNKGRLAMEGEPEAVMDYYNAMLADHQMQSITQVVQEDGKVQTISGTGEVMVSGIKLTDDAGFSLEVLDVGQHVHLKIQVTSYADIDRLILGYSIRDRLGQVVYGTNTHLKQQPLNSVRAGEVYQFDIDFDLNLGPGTYSVQTALHSTENHFTDNYEWRDRALVFSVVNTSKHHFAGISWIDPRIAIDRI